MTHAVEKARAREQLNALAVHFAGRHDAILKRWRTATENAPELTVASSLTRLQFNDHIPGVLDAFAVRLRTWPGEERSRDQKNEKEQVKQHGLQRWQQGYQLRELTREWANLQVCLMEELEGYAAAHPGLEPQVMPAARRALAALCWDGISDSATQYWQLHQTEAAGRVRDLEQALATLKDLGRLRAETWREAAHDLRGSVAVVRGAASLLHGGEAPERVRQQVVDVLQQGVASLQEMLYDLMSLARLDAGQEQRQVGPFDAAVLLTDLCTTSQPLAQERGLFLKMEGPDALPVEGDRGKVQRILQNLLLNALKYTRRGGVKVIWGAVEDCDPESWMFCVQDSGPGLDAGPDAPMARQLHEATQSAHKVEDVPRQGMADDSPIAAAPTVSARSETLPQSQIPGEGVGLSIVKRLCELLDASLELETSPGEGTTFRVVLPSQYVTSAKSDGAQAELPQHLVIPHRQPPRPPAKLKGEARP